MKKLLALLFFALPLTAQTLPNVTDTTTPPRDFNTLRLRHNALVKRINAAQAPVDQQNRALLLFQLEQSRLLLAEVEQNLVTYPELTLAAVERTLARGEVVAAAKGDAAQATGQQTQVRAYIAANDGSVQPYWVFLPKDYSAKKKYPLALFLHGYSPYISKVNPWIPDETTSNAFTERGFVLAIPYGRRNTDFVGVGEDDTMIVTQQVMANYSIDPGRVFLMGASMGGFGVYTIGLHQPDLWAGLSPMAGRTDFYLWFKLDRAAVPEWKQVLFDANDPRHLKANARNLPIFVQHGEADTLNTPEHSRLLVADLKALGSPVRYREVVGGDHYIYFDVENFIVAIEWAAKVTRQPPGRRVTYTSADLRNHRSSWVKLDSFEDYGKSASIDAEVKAENAVAVTATNLSGFTLTPPATFFKPGKPVTLTVNGQADARTFAIGQPIAWPGKEVAADAFPGTKSPQRSGPVKNVYRDPFLVVFGTKVTVPSTKPNAPPVNPDRDAALRFATEWSVYCDGFPRVKADKDVTAEDRKNFNLILLGTRASNSVLAEISDKLPLELTAIGYRLGTQNFPTANPEKLGVQFCYPSPFDARRMVVVQSGLFWGEHLPPNHKFDLIPDYIVYDETIEPGAQKDHFDLTDQTNRALVKGFFDGNWQVGAGK